MAVSPASLTRLRAMHAHLPAAPAAVLTACGGGIGTPDAEGNPSALDPTVYTQQ